MVHTTCKCIYVHRILELTKEVSSTIWFSVCERDSPAWLEGFICLNFLGHKETGSPASFQSIDTLCVCVHVYTHSMHCSNGANNTLHLCEAGSKEYKQWFMRNPSQCFPVPFSCLCVCNSSHPQSPSGRAGVGLQPGSREKRMVWNGRDI